MNIKKPAVVNFYNITFKNAHGYEFGGAIIMDKSDVYVKNCIFDNNYAGINGGAICNSGTDRNNYGHLTVRDCVFTNNYADHDGGAIATRWGYIDIYHSVFKYNYAFRDGGAVRTGIYSQTRIFNSIFEENEAREWGGALYNWPGVLEVYNCSIKNNTAGERGGAIITSGPLIVKNSTITNNYAGVHGGAIYIDEETPDIQSTTIISGNNIYDNEAGWDYHDIFIERTTSETTSFNDNYWGTNNPLNGTDYKYNWTNRVNNYKDFEVITSWITKNPEEENKNATISTDNETNINNDKKEDFTKTETEKPLENNNNTNSIPETLSEEINHFINGTSEKVKSNVNSYVLNKDILTNSTKNNVGENNQKLSKDNSQKSSSKEITKKDTNKKISNDHRIAYIILIVIVILILGCGYYYYRK